MSQSSNLSTVARPYAQAAFEVASESSQFDAWSKLLGGLSALVRDPAGAALVRHPAIAPADLAEAILEALKGADEAGSNFIRLLAERRRLVAAAQIAEQYEALRDEAEGRINVEARTAHALDDKAAAALRDSLAKRLGRSVELKVQEDEGLIGGVVLRAGDLVIDGSVKGQLDRLATAMSH
ncbi:F0F1 ATP synthase subunit delta [Natronospira bacteriovora]|uniref:ATP synthase subunit delta n=1 Tax=Natronospira bacteriovora TaxID=3069753 RepID=A0ABU0W6R3_9GAMM|nr:F0F1 ATP synthase subunit delta [Natronospira sp. AB-CW4]MDQ2069723.1 F0F1 ATP synthase subunit delta [Natronospira sp. AB-CW4]